MEGELDFYGGLPNPLLIDWQARPEGDAKAYGKWFRASVLYNAQRLRELLASLSVTWDPTFAPDSVVVLEEALRTVAAVRPYDASVDRNRGGFGLFLCSFDGTDGATVVVDDRALFCAALVAVYCGEVYRREARSVGLEAKWRRCKRASGLSFGQTVLWTRTRRSTGELDMNVEVVRRLRHSLERGDALVLSSLVAREALEARGSIDW